MYVLILKIIPDIASYMQSRKSTAAQTTTNSVSDLMGMMKANLAVQVETQMNQRLSHQKQLKFEDAWLGGSEGSSSDREEHVDDIR